MHYPVQLWIIFVIKLILINDLNKIITTQGEEQDEKFVFCSWGVTENWINIIFRDIEINNQMNQLKHSLG